MTRTDKKKDELTTDTGRPRAALAERSRRFAREQKRSPLERRRLVAELLAAGRTVPDVAQALRTTTATVLRDLGELRRRAADRQLATEPEVCAPLFLEEAVGVVQKVRTEQEEAEKHDSTFYFNLLKLEWAMLIKLVEMTRPPRTKKAGEPAGLEEDLADCSNEELLAKARELGIDTTGYERALRAAPDAVEEAA